MKAQIHYSVPARTTGYTHQTCKHSHVQRGLFLSFEGRDKQKNADVHYLNAFIWDFKLMKPSNENRLYRLKVVLIITAYSNKGKDTKLRSSSAFV